MRLAFSHVFGTSAPLNAAVLCASVILSCGCGVLKNVVVQWTVSARVILTSHAHPVYVGREFVLWCSRSSCVGLKTVDFVPFCCKKARSVCSGCWLASEPSRDLWPALHFVITRHRFPLNDRISLILSDITDTGLLNLALMIIMIHQD